ncbi:MAG: hypothetical protein KAQ94_00990 [Arcobacteraceae bacterium]|nr:hypothetical protein [Arcobacteraceae bacterium]
MNFFHSIKFKIFVVIVVFFTIMITMHMLYDINMSKKQLNTYLQNLNQSSAKLLNKNVQSDLYNLNYTNVKYTIDSFDNPYFKNIYILNKNGYIFAQRDNDKIMFTKYKDFEKLLNLQNENPLLYFLPVILSKKVVGYLVIENNNEIFEQMIKSKESEILKMFFIFLLVTIVFSYIVSVIITKPINKIINKLKNLDEKEELEFNHNKKDEFGYLAKIIEQNHKKIRDLNENLEIRVKEEVEKNIYKEKQLFEAQKMASMGEMIGNIAHQWRQPLSVISTGSTAIKLKKELDVLDDKDLLETCEIINENAQYLSKTIDDFKNFIKGDKKLINFNLKDTIDSFINLVNPSIKNNNIELILNIKENININGYPNELHQCMINIFNNAKDALLNIDETRLVFIDTLLQDNNAIIKIKDNAGGIPEDVMPKIFEPYFTTKHKSQGTGLGLHMTYNLIVDSMGGTIEANNVKYKYNDESYIGAEFTIRLPLS